MTPAEQAHQICKQHLDAHPEMANVPIQSVYEWLAAAIEQARGEEREAVLWDIRRAHRPDCYGPGPCGGCTLISQTIDAIRTRAQERPNAG